MTMIMTTIATTTIRGARLMQAKLEAIISRFGADTGTILTIVRKSERNNDVLSIILRLPPAWPV
jgi:hypothetical protein